MKRLIPVLFCFAAVFGCGAQTGDPAWDSRRKGKWDEAFDLVSIPSAKDGKSQQAFAHWSRSEKPRPLVVSLHTWGGNFSQEDPLAALAVAADWNYIHPDFRGPNISPDACLSGLVVSDVDDAVSFMLGDKRVDRDNVFLVGVSGGGHVACGMFLGSRHSFRRILAWVPITDLEAWYRECAGVPGKSHYAKEVLACVGATDGHLDEREAKARSPLFMDFPQKLPTGIDIYAGIDDGWKGSVPISHSILFYNRIAEKFEKAAKVSGEEIQALCGRKIAVPEKEAEKLGDRTIYFSRGFAKATLTIFQGSHEMLTKPCFEKLQALVDSPHAAD